MNYLPDPTIPQPIYDALVDSDAEYGNEVREYLSGIQCDHAVSVTSLLKSPRRFQLEKRHYNDIVVNPVDDLWNSMLGTIVHYILERYGRNDDNYLTELRQGVTFDINGKRVHLHGKFDSYDVNQKHLRDYKFTKATSMLYDKEEHELQLNILKYICDSRDMPVDRISNVYLFPHLDKMFSKKEGYPSRNIQEKEYNVRPREEIEKLIRHRLKLHSESSSLKDDDLPECTDAERWIRETVWKVYLLKKDGKGFSSRAAFSSTDRKEVRDFIDRLNGERYTEEVKKGKPTACIYCKGNVFCNQLQKEIRNNPKLLED